MVYTGALQRDYERLNMMTLQEFLEKQFDENLMLAVISGQRSKEKQAPSFQGADPPDRTERQRLLSGILHGGNQGPSLQLQQRRSDRICGTEFSGGWIFPAAGAGKMQRWQCSCQQKG